MDENAAMFSQIMTQLAVHDEKINLLFSRQDEVKKMLQSVNELTASVKVFAVSQQAVEKKVDKLSDDIEGMKGRPGKRWESLMLAMLAALGGGLVSFVLVRLGLK